MPCCLANASILAYLAEVLRRGVLNVVIDGEHRLARIVNRRRADLLELRDDRAGVVVRHHVLGADRDEVAGAAPGRSSRRRASWRVFR